MLPPGEGNNIYQGNNIFQTNSQAGALLPSREVSSPSQAINSTPASSQASGIHPNSPLAIAHLPPWEGSNSLPAAALLPSGIAGSSSSQAITLRPLQEGSNASQATALLPPSDGSSIPQAISSSQAKSQASGIPLSLLQQLLTFLPAKEAILTQQLLTFLWVKATVLPRLLLTFLLGKETMPPRSLLSFLPVKEAAFPRPLALPRQGSLVIQLGQSGRAVGIPPGTGHPSLPMRIASSPPPPPVGCPKVLLMKNPTLSWSLTFPTNLWNQLKGLFWLKDPTLWLSPGSLLTYST